MSDPVVDILIPFVGALALAFFAFEVLSAFRHMMSAFGRRSRLNGAASGDSPPAVKERSTWEALLVNILPNRFDPEHSKRLPDVIDLLRRAGYPYDTPGEFYAAAMRTFSFYLAIGGGVAGALVMLDMAFAAPIAAIVFVYLGLRRPYARLRGLAKKRGEAMKNNTLIGLSVMCSLIRAGVGVQDALRRTASVGGPFCNLLGLLVSQLDKHDYPAQALEVTRAHLPNTTDVEVNLFFRDVEDNFVNNRPILSSIQALREAVHRNVVEAAEERAALVRQRSGLFGIMAVIGLLVTIILPFMVQAGF